MIEFAPTMLLRHQLRTLFTQLKNIKLRQFSTFDFRSLYCFGVRDHRNFSVYISPNIPRSRELITYLRENHNIAATNTRVGNPAPRNWIAFSTTFRQNQTEMCARICLLTSLTLNHRINFQVT